MKITIRGEVDRKAIDQLEACAVAGDAPVAAQMADGHLGYGLSIGGVLGLPDPHPAYLDASRRCDGRS